MKESRKKSKSKYTPEIVEFIKNYYPENGAVACVEILGPDFCEKGLTIFCCRNGIKIKKDYEGENFDIELFKNPSTPQMAYFLGMVWGDGNVDQSRISLSLVIEDGNEIYEFFRDLGHFKTYYKYTDPTRKDILLIRAYNKPIAQYLLTMDYGVKSLVSPTKILSTIPKDMHRYFWLGFADADGCWYVGEKSFQFFMTGSYDQNWNDFSQFLEDINCQYSYRQYSRDTGSQSYLQISNVFDIKLFGDILYQSYDENHIGLKRKYNKYLEIKEGLEKNRISQNFTRGIVVKNGRIYSNIEFLEKDIILGILKTFKAQLELMTKKR